MPLKSYPTFNQTADKTLEIAQPGIGGINLKDLEYEQETNQSPKMLNMMYRNGYFSKRYGQEIYDDFDDEIYASTYFNNSIVIHTGEKILKEEDGEWVQLGTGLQCEKGMFMHYNMGLYYICNGDYFQYVYDYDLDDYVWGAVTPLIPEIYTECKPDGSESNEGEELNVLSNYFDVAFNGDGSTKDFKIGKIVDAKNELINWNGTVKVWVNDTLMTSGYTVDGTNKKITFSTAPTSGDDNVIIRMTLNKSVYENQRDAILHAQCYSTYGGVDNARLFLGGFGERAKGHFIFSEACDATFFPIYNFELIGNSAEDITGFGLQYNTLFVFKANELYSLASYTQTYATTSDETEVGLETFKAQLVNAARGCDAPNTIQIIDNKLTWFHTAHGVCTLVSSSIIDERNVRPISRNIDKTNNFDIVGILDIDCDPDEIVSVDYDNKYFLSFPNGTTYVWDYQISPYYYTASKETEVKNLDWFLFDNFYIKEYLKVGNKLYYIGLNKEVGDGFTGGLVNVKNLNKCIVGLDLSFRDLDFNKDGTNDGISSYYMTPLFEFGAVEYLKTIKNIYVQCRGVDTTRIDMSYITEDTPYGESEPETINIYGNLWNKFSWEGFGWEVTNFMNTFRRKCAIKKVQLLGIMFENNELNSDMSISHLALQYQVIKYIK